ncbi:portal protein [Brucella anthropi]|uniref:portal protein n=1 Tax=Brucella anthropi TaxID=529 RepID=UPI0021663282|nr:portal protein [Brucella anthropi]UVV67077.1 portal protein [Brucella anthropi]
MAKNTISKKVDEQALANRFAGLVQGAVGVSSAKIADKNTAALKYYMREPFPFDLDKNGNPIRDAKSKYVSSDVQERTDWAVGQGVRIFDNQWQVVSFSPNEPNDQPIADEMTEVCNFIMRNKNSHVAILSPWLTNGFLTGLGIAMVELRKDREELLPEMVKGLTDIQLVQIEQQEEAGKIIIEERGDPYFPDTPPPTNLPPELAALAQQMQPQVRDIKIRKVRENVSINIRSLPPEDFIVSRDADIDEQTGGIKATLQGHKRVISRADLIDMGFDKAKVDKIPLSESDLEGMAQERALITDYDTSGVTGDEVTVYEIYTFTAIEDKKRRHYRITLAGDLETKPVLLHYEEVSKFYPYAPFVPFPIPNTLFGEGMIDRVGPTQKLVSQIIRAQHDNLNKYVDPMVVINPEVTRHDDLLNPYPGKVIRSEDPTAGISWVQPPFTAMQAQPIIDNLKTELDYTTGVGGSLASVNASDLQNTTATANAQRASSQQMLIEKVCRHFADTGYRYIFRVIIDLLANNPEEAQRLVTRLTGKFTPIRIDEWDADMDITANVAFGVTDKMGNAANLQAILALQMQLQPMGLANPQTIYATATKLAENAGFKNAGMFFIDPSTLPPPPPAPPPPDPNAALIAEMKLKAEVDAKSKAAEYEFEMRKLYVENDLKRDQMAQDLELKRAEIEAKYQAEVNVAKIQAEQDRRRTDVDYAIALNEAQTQLQQAQGMPDAQSTLGNAPAQKQAQGAPEAPPQPMTPPGAGMMPPQQ